ncbi:MAG: Fe2+-dependent dioxygenase [Pseudomonadota bacterium]
MQLAAAGKRVLIISDTLSDKDLKRCREMIAEVAWQDGRSTAGRTAKKIKKNEQADLSTPVGQALSSLVRDALLSNAVFTAAARPKKLSKLIVSKTANGGHYGPHNDNAIMGRGDGRIRTDLSFTLFLAPPEAYEGGELIVHGAGEAQSIKGSVGDLALYPSSSLHEVRPVTTGERVVCVGWVESLIRSDERRSLLFDLENLRATLRVSMDGNSPELLTLDKTIANLIRMWAET